MTRNSPAIANPTATNTSMVLTLLEAGSNEIGCDGVEAEEILKS